MAEKAAKKTAGSYLRAAKNHSCPVHIFTRCSTPSDESHSVSALEASVDHYLLAFIQRSKDINTQSVLTDINSNTVKWFICGIRSAATFYLMSERITWMYSSLPHDLRLFSLAFIK